MKEKKLYRWIDFCYWIRLSRVSPFKSYVEEEEKTSKVTLEKSREELKLYERYFDLCMETIDCLAISTERKLFDSKAKEAISVILPSIVQSMQSIRLLQIRGYYYASAIAARSLLESIGLCEYLALNEEEAIGWLRGKAIKVASIHLFNYAIELSHREASLESETRRVYGLLCDYVHSNVRAVADFIEPDVKVRGRVNLQFVPEFDEKQVGTIAAYPLLVTLMLESVFKKELKPYKKRQKKSRRLLKLLEETGSKEEKRDYFEAGRNS